MKLRLSKRVVPNLMAAGMTLIALSGCTKQEGKGI